MHNFLSIHAKEILILGKGHFIICTSNMNFYDYYQTFEIMNVYARNLIIDLG